MCGICGVLDFNGQLSPVYDMNQRLRHRGPNDEGYAFINSRTNHFVSVAGPDTPVDVGVLPYWAVKLEGFDLALGNRRLAVLDTSSAGHMPMSYADGRFWITYNGEVYNYRELKSELEHKGHRFLSDSDTEVVLAAYAEWGPACLPRFNGMFAFALWDAQTRTLFCARDRFGVKPFYYFWDRSVFVFGSEIKSLVAHPTVPRTPNDRAVFEYLALGLSDHADETFLEGVLQLRPGHAAVLDISGRNLRVYQWWHVEVNPELGDSMAADDARVCRAFAELLEDSVRLRLRTDVAIGSCLSGGLDSSAIVGLTNRLLRNEQVIAPELVGEHQRTFTARYKESEIDEYRFSHRVVQETGAQENIVFPSGPDLWRELDTYVWHMDEPVNSTSQYAQWNVMRLASSRGVTVLLDGQGGDEILAGYPTYYPTYIRQLWHKQGWLAAAQGAWDVARVAEAAGVHALSSDLRHRLPGRLQRLSGLLPTPKLPPGHGGSGLQAWQLAIDLQQKYYDRRWRPDDESDGLGLAGVLHRDLTTTNLPKLLRFEDRNSMAFSLETRLPFLDYRLVDLVFSLPLKYRLHRGWNKWILRSSLQDIVPDEIRWRRSKLGFPTPEYQWLLQGSKHIRERLLSHSSTSLHSYLQPGVMERICQQSDVELASVPGLWRILNLAVWLDVFCIRREPQSNPVILQSASIT